MASPMTVGSSAAGGYLADDPVFHQQVARAAIERATILQFPTEVPTSKRLVHLHKQVSLPTLGWVAEGGSKPVSSFQVGRDSLAVKELAGIIGWTDRLDAESFSDPGIRLLIKNAIADAAADTIDRALMAVAAAPSNGPQGIFNQTGWTLHTYGSGDDLGENIRRAKAKARLANGRPTALLCHPAVTDALLAIRTDDGALKYGEVLSGRIWGLQIVDSLNVPSEVDSNGRTSDAMLVDASSWYVAIGPMDVQISNSATIDFGDGAGLTSLFQKDMTAIRHVQNVSSIVAQFPLQSVVMRDIPTDD